MIQTLKSKSGTTYNLRKRETNGKTYYEVEDKCFDPQYEEFEYFTIGTFETEEEAKRFIEER